MDNNAGDHLLGQQKPPVSETTHLLKRLSKDNQMKWKFLFAGPKMNHGGQL
jgi:hypothetical protein